MKYLKLENLPLADKIGLAVAAAIEAALIFFTVFGPLRWFIPVIFGAALLVSYLVFMYLDARESFNTLQDEVAADVAEAKAEVASLWDKIRGSSTTTPAA